MRKTRFWVPFCCLFLQIFGIFDIRLNLFQSAITSPITCLCCEFNLTWYFGVEILVSHTYFFCKKYNSLNLQSKFVGLKVRKLLNSSFVFKRAPVVQQDVCWCLVVDRQWVRKGCPQSKKVFDCLQKYFTSYLTTHKLSKKQHALTESDCSFWKWFLIPGHDIHQFLLKFVLDFL